MMQAKQAGAAYIITPAFDEDLIKAALKAGLPIFPGVFSPAEVMRALRLGLKQLKLFPAGDLGPSYVASLRGPFPEAEFIGVGGISLDNLAEFWRAGCRRFAVGSDMVPRGAVAADHEAVSARARAYIEAVSRLS
jgi:2-keto-3-deoxy-6-phosphogluconate aldolase